MGWEEKVVIAMIDGHSAFRRVQLSARSEKVRGAQMLDMSGPLCHVGRGFHRLAGVYLPIRWNVHNRR